eukprot:798692-Amphidinium_carterae.1
MSTGTLPSKTSISAWSQRPLCLATQIAVVWPFCKGAQHQCLAGSEAETDFGILRRAVEGATGASQDCLRLCAVRTPAAKSLLRWTIVSADAIVTHQGRVLTISDVVVKGWERRLARHMQNGRQCGRRV